MPLASRILGGGVEAVVGMRWMAWFIFGLVALTLQVVVIPRLAPSGFRPDLALLFVVTMTAYERGVTPLVVAWLMGMLVDQHSLERLGLVAMSYLLVALGVAGLRRAFSLGGVVMLTGTTFLAAAATQLLWAIYRAWMYGAGGLGSAPSWKSILMSAGLTAILALPVAGLLRWFGVREGRRLRVRSSRRS